MYRYVERACPLCRGNARSTWVVDLCYEHERCLRQHGILKQSALDQKQAKYIGHLKTALGRATFAPDVVSKITRCRKKLLKRTPSRTYKALIEICDQIIGSATN